MVLDCSMFPTQCLEVVHSDILLDEEDPSVGNLRITECKFIQKTTSNNDISNNSNNNNNNNTETITTTTSSLSSNRLSYFQQSFYYQIFQIFPLVEQYYSTTQMIPNSVIQPTSSMSMSIPTKESCFEKNSNSNTTDGLYQTELIIPRTITTNNNNNNNNKTGLDSLATIQMTEIMKSLTDLLNKRLHKHSHAMNNNDTNNTVNEKKTDNSSKSYYDCLQDVVLTQLYLSDMSLFAVINEAYGNYFHSSHSTTTPPPPCRCCVAIPLNNTNNDNANTNANTNEKPIILVCASFTVLQSSSAAALQHSLAVTPHAMYSSNTNNIIDNNDTNNSKYTADESMTLTNIWLEKKRKTVYIRSISEWAPVCIGPYSQANLLYECLIFVSGQIPLIPGSMAVWSERNSSPSMLLNHLYQLAPHVMSYYYKLLHLHESSATTNNNIDINNCNNNITSIDSISHIKSYWELLLLQYLLCFRHVSSLLLIQNSQLPLIQSCVVYIDSTQFPADFDLLLFKLFMIQLTNIIVRKGYDDYNTDDEQLIYTTNTINNDNSDGNSNDSDDSDDESNTLNPAMGVVTMVVFVKGLPRNALVEIEVKACTNIFPNHQFLYSNNMHNNNTNANNILKLEMNQRLINIQRQSLQAILSPIKNINNYFNFIPTTLFPTHSSNSDNNSNDKSSNISSDNINYNKTDVSSASCYGSVNNAENKLYGETSVNNTTIMSDSIIDDVNSIYQMKYYKRCLCVGSMDLCFTNNNNNNKTISNKEITESPISRISQHIVLYLMNQLMISEVSILCLKNITLYYTPMTMSSSDVAVLKQKIQQQIYSYIHHLFSSSSHSSSQDTDFNYTLSYSDVSIILLPVSQIVKNNNHSHSNNHTPISTPSLPMTAAMTVHYFAVDFLKLRSEYWIHSSSESSST